MRNEGLEGILQDMLKKGKESKILVDSRIVLYDNSSYFVTTNNKDVSLNSLTVGFNDRVIYPTGYLIKSYPDLISYLRGWNLFGSLDGNTWTNIHTSHDSNKLENGQVGRYELNGGPFRYFKIVQTEPCLTSDENFKYKLRIMYIEFFGFSWTGVCTKPRYNKHISFEYIFVLIFLC